MAIRCVTLHIRAYIFRSVNHTKNRLMDSLEGILLNVSSIFVI